MLELVYAIFGAILGALLWEVGKTWWVARLERSAQHTGQWRAAISGDASEGPKEDLWEMRQKGDEMFGTITRQLPEAQAGRRWTFRGRIVGRDFIAAFWGSSSGVWFLRKPRGQDWVFEGRYLSIHDVLLPDGAISGHLDSSPLRVTHLARDRRG